MPQIRQAETRTRDLLGYAGAPPDPHWPGGARVAVSIVVNFEEGAELSISDGDPENEAYTRSSSASPAGQIRRSTAISNMAHAPAGGGSWRCSASMARRRR